MVKSDKKNVENESFKPNPWDHLRFEVYKRDGFKCQYCGWHKDMGKDNILNVDHIIPRAEGGRDELSNLLTSCRKCNQGKWYISLLDHLPPLNWILRKKIRVKRKYAKLLKKLIDIEAEIEELESGERTIERRLKKIQGK